MFFFDCHVHIYKLYNLNEFFEKVYENINIVKYSYNTFFSDVVLLRAFNKEEYSLREIYNHLKLIEDLETSPLFFDESNILSIKYKDLNLTIIDGRQIKTCEKLEVITFDKMDDKLIKPNLKSIINKLNSSNEIVIIPWGFGKWTFKRIRLLEEIMNYDNVFFSNSSNRPYFWPKEKMLNKNNLPGSDPLPISNGYKDVCMFGSLIKSSLNEIETLNSIKTKILESDKILIEKYPNPLRTIYEQFKLNIIG